MKKLFAIALVVIMALSLAACDSKPQEETTAKGPDLSQFPADLKDWTAADYNNYFIQAGVYENNDKAYVQDHASYWVNTPIYEGSGYMDDVTGDYIFIFTFDPDSKEADVPAYMDSVRATKSTGKDYSDIPIDHMVANMCISYTFCQTESVYQAAEKAFNDLVAAMNATPDF